MNSIPQYGSQYGEDLTVRKLLPPVGRLLDVGAWQPVTFSNNRRLIDEGWKAVLVEFSPNAVHALIKEYGQNPNVDVLQAAATVVDDCFSRFDVTDDSVSTNTPAIREKWDAEGGYFGKLWVVQRTLASILNQFGGGFDFVSIDTEGTSVDLAVHFLRDLKQRPKVLIVEHDNRQTELMQAAKNAGYVGIDDNGTNMILELR